MKRFLLFLAVIITAYAANAQNTFPSSGRVGIYTTAPTASLQVNGGAKIGKGSNYVKIDSATGNLSFAGTGGYLVANNHFVFTAASTPLTGLYYNSTNNRYEFRSATGIPVLNINTGTGGKIGIGTTKPLSQLHINNTDLGSSTILTLTDSFSNFINTAQIALKNSASTDRALQFWNQNQSATATTVAYNFLDNSSASLFSILNGGNVGIGTATPSGKLDVVNGNVHVLYTNGDGSYTKSEAIFEADASSSYHPSIALHNDYDNSGCQLFGSGNGLSVADETGFNELPVLASAFNVSSTFDKKSQKNFEQIENKDFDGYLQQIRNIETVSYQDNSRVLSTTQQTSQNTASASSHLVINGTSLPKALQINIPTSAKIKPEYKIGYNIADIESLNLIGIKALDAKTQQIAQENAELKQENIALQKQVNVILEKLNDLQAVQSTSSVTTNSQHTAISSASMVGLQQNAPNPFKSATVIRYILPQHFSNAQIVITDANGITIKRSTVTSSGSINVAAGSLASGTYKYSLIVDGNLIDTKTMVLTK